MKYNTLTNLNLEPGDTVTHRGSSYIYVTQYDKNGKLEVRSSDGYQPVEESSVSNWAIHSRTAPWHTYNTYEKDGFEYKVVRRMKAKQKVSGHVTYINGIPDFSTWKED